MMPDGHNGGGATEGQTYHRIRCPVCGEPCANARHIRACEGGEQS